MTKIYLVISKVKTTSTGRVWETVEEVFTNKKLAENAKIYWYNFTKGCNKEYETLDTYVLEKNISHFNYEKLNKNSGWE